MLPNLSEPIIKVDRLIHQIPVYQLYLKFITKIKIIQKVIMCVY